MKDFEGESGRRRGAMRRDVEPVRERRPQKFGGVQPQIQRDTSAAIAPLAPADQRAPAQGERRRGRNDSFGVGGVVAPLREPGGSVQPSARQDRPGGPPQRVAKTDAKAPAPEPVRAAAPSDAPGKKGVDRPEQRKTPAVRDRGGEGVARDTVGSSDEPRERRKPASPSGQREEDVEPRRAGGVRKPPPPTEPPGPSATPSPEEEEPNNLGKEPTERDEGLSQRVVFTQASTEDAGVAVSSSGLKDTGGEAPDDELLSMIRVHKDRRPLFTEATSMPGGPHAAALREIAATPVGSGDEKRAVDQPSQPDPARLPERIDTPAADSPIEEKREAKISEATDTQDPDSALPGPILEAVSTFVAKFGPVLEQHTSSDGSARIVIDKSLTPQAVQEHFGLDRFQESLERFSGETDTSTEIDCGKELLGSVEKSPGEVKLDIFDPDSPSNGFEIIYKANEAGDRLIQIAEFGDRILKSGETVAYHNRIVLWFSGVQPAYTLAAHYSTNEEVQYMIGAEVSVGSGRQLIATVFTDSDRITRLLGQDLSQGTSPSILTKMISPISPVKTTEVKPIEKIGESPETGESYL